MTDFSKYKRHFVLDVEADGPHPVYYNMISFGIVNLADSTKTFKGECFPLHNNNGGNKKARQVSGITWKEQLHYPASQKVMESCVEYIMNVTDGKRPIIWSDNPSFDGSFFNAYMHIYYGDNPCGWSIRRIGDFSAGLKRKPMDHSSWKKLRKTKHSHCPVDDALGNVEALQELINTV